MHPFSQKILLSLAALALAITSRGAVAGELSGAPLSREVFVASIAENLSAHFNLEGELQLELLRPWTAPGRVARNWTVEIAEYPTLIAAAILTRCRLFADGQPAGEYHLTMKASLWRDAWSVREPVTANLTFDPSILEVRRVDFLRERDALPATVGDRSFMFARSVTPNRLLTWRDVTRRSLVRKGEIVEVAAVDGLLQVTMRGLALENGAAGDTVTIRNPESKKNFAAQVVAENRVQIRF